MDTFLGFVLQSVLLMIKMMKIPSQIQPHLTNMYFRTQTLALMTYEPKNQTIGQKGRILDHITMDYSSFCKNIHVSVYHINLFSQDVYEILPRFHQIFIKYILICFHNIYRKVASSNTLTLGSIMFGTFVSVWCKTALAEVGVSLP